MDSLYPTQSLPQNITPTIIQQRFSPNHEFLIFSTSPLQPYWVPAHQLQYQFQDLITSFLTTQKTKFDGQPVSVIKKDGQTLAHFRFWSNDFYVSAPLEIDFKSRLINYKKIPTSPSSPAEACAKLLCTTPNQSTWTQFTEPSDIAILAILYGYKGKIGIYGVNYYKNAEYILKYGITSSKDYQDGYQITFYDTPPLKDHLDVILTKQHVTTNVKTKVLCLNSTNFNNENVEFLCGKKLNNMELFRQLEIGILNKNQSEINNIPLLIQKSQNKLENSLVFKYMPGLSELTRVKHYLDTDSQVNNFFTNQLNQTQFLAYSAVITSNLLKLHWQKLDTEIGERQALLKQIISSLFKYSINNMLFIVPDVTYQATKNFLVKNIPQVSLNFTFENVNFGVQKSIILLSETQIMAYNLCGVKINKNSLPQVVILPFISTRDITLLASDLYQNSQSQPPKFLMICAEKSTEMNFLKYKLAFPHIVNLEFQNLSKVFSEQKIKTYDAAIQLLKLKGNNGKMGENGFDWAELEKFNIIEPNDIIMDKNVRQTTNFYLQNELILQASLGYMFNINDNYNYKLLDKMINEDFKSEIHISYGNQGFDVKDLFLYQIQNNKIFIGSQLSTPLIANEQISRYFSMQGASSAQKQLSSFLQTARNFKPTDVYTQEQKRTKVSKNYFIIPAIAPENDNYQLINVFTKNIYKQNDLTLCSSCFEKAILYGKTCDVCDKQMDQINEEIPFQIKKGVNSWNLSGIFNKNDILSQNTEFVINKNLTFVQMEPISNLHSMVLKGKKQELSDSMLEKIQTILSEYQQEDQKSVFQSLMSILDGKRAGYVSGTVNKYVECRPTLQIVVDLAIADFLMQNNAVLSQNQLTSLNILPLKLVFQTVSPLILCQFNDQIEQLIDDKQKFQGDYILSLLKVMETSPIEIVKFMSFYIKNNHIEYYHQLFSKESSNLFYENLLKFHLKQLHSNFSSTNSLINYSTFDSKLMNFDNPIVNFLFTNQEKGEFLRQLHVQQIKSNEIVQSAQITAFLRYQFIQISKSHYIYVQKDIQTLLNQCFKQRDFTFLNNTLQPGFSPVIFMQNSAFQFEKNIDLIDPVIKQPELKIERKLIQNIIQQPVQQSKPVSQKIHQKQSPALQIPSQIHIPSTVPMNPVKLENNIKIPQFNPPSLPLPSLSISQLPQIPQIKQEPQMQLKIPIPTSPISQPGSFFDLSLQSAKKKAPIQHIHRIIAHYSCRSYYYRQNLLYVPSIRQIYAKDALSHQLGLIVPNSDLKTPNSDPDFDVLLQILTNDFQVQNKLKHSNVHKFCTVFNDEAKSRLEKQSSKPQLPLQFYDSEKYLLLTQWLLKRTLQAECDLIRGTIISFAEDPVFGSDLSEFDVKTNESSKLRFAKQADVVFTMTDSEARQAYNDSFQICEKYDKEYRERQILFLVKIGIGTGSTPLETFYRFIQKEDPYKVTEILTNLVKLLTLCAAKGFDFPYKVAGVSANLEQVQQSIYRLEHMRFLHIKLQQFDFLQWLQRLQKFKNSEMTEKEREFISSIVQKSLSCDIRNIYSSTYKQDLNDHECKVIDWISEVAGSIDNFNQVLWAVDLKFNAFLFEKDPSFNSLRHFKLEKFAINDFDQSHVKKAWEITLQFKILFMLVFGDNKHYLLELVDQKLITQSDIKMVDQIFSQLQSMWSRLHDFILMHIITDMGYTEAMMQSIVGKDLRQKSKHVEFLRQGFFAEEENFSIQNTKLYQIYSQIPQNSDNVTFFAEFPNLNSYLFTQNKLYFPSKSTIVQSIIAARQINIDDFFTKNMISKDLLTRRVERIAHALRCERILTCDPLQKYLQDKAVNLIPPNGTIPQVLGVQEILFLQQPVPINTTPTQQIITVKIPQFTIPSVPIPTISIPQTPPAIITPKHLPKKQQQQPPPQTEHFQPPQPPTLTYIFQPIDMPKSALRFVKNTKLSFFMEKDEEVTAFIKDIVKDCNGQDQLERASDMDSFLFYFSSCQKQNSEDWGRLYSFLIKDTPQPLELSKQQIKHSYNQILQFAQSTFNSQNSADVFARMQVYIYGECKQSDSVKYDELAQKFVEAQLNIAYYYAFEMRRAIVERAGDWQSYKGLIQNAFQAMQIMNQMPLNLLISKDCNQNKRKMALSTYFYLSQSPE